MKYRWMVLVFSEYYEHKVVSKYLDKCDCNKMKYKTINFIIEGIQDNEYVFSFLKYLIFSSVCIQLLKI